MKSNQFLNSGKSYLMDLPEDLKRNLQKNLQGQKNFIFRLFCLRQVQQFALKSSLSLLILSLSLTSCSWITDENKDPSERTAAASRGTPPETGPPETGPPETGAGDEGSLDPQKPKLSLKEKKTLQAFYTNNCIDEESYTFKNERAKEHLYGIDCLAGKQLIVKTSKPGERVGHFTSDLTTLGSSSSAERDRQGSTVRLDFINTAYKVKYEILKSESKAQNSLEGKEYEIPLLYKFLSEGEEFYGSEDTKYHILFVLRGNYLVLYKASKDKNDIPYTERTSLEKLEKVTKTSTNSQGKEIKRSYWLNSPYEETQNFATSPDTDSSSNGTAMANDKQDDEDTLYGVPWLGWEAAFCNVNQIESLSDGPLTHFERDSCNKKPIEAQYMEANIEEKKLYQFVNKKELFPANFFDGTWFQGIAAPSSSDIRDEVHLNPAYLVKIERKPEKLEFIDESGSNIIEDAYRESSYKPITDLKINWKQYKMKMTSPDMIDSSFREEEITTENDTERPYLQIDFTPLQQAGASIKEVILDKDWFSVVSSQQMQDGTVATVKHSYLRSSALNQKGMEQRRRFKQDHHHLFGIFRSIPRIILKGTANEEEKEQHYRMIHFNTNAEKEIKWYFSKQSPKGEYRDLARKAVEIYNDAFQHISGGKITVTMASDTEDKDQGDFRYNTIHLMDGIDTGSRSLFGRTLSFVNPDTGQIIGALCNVNIERILKNTELHIKSYIRAKLFYPDRLNPASSYFQSQIESQCKEVNNFIQNPKTQEGRAPTTPSDKLDDTEVYKECAKKISKARILNIILHEMGHNFGLSHNFKASADEDNYWKNEEDINKVFQSKLFIDNENLPKSSSVMDYPPYNEIPVLTVLGKYDLATLRFLYMNEIEKSDGSFEPLPIEWDKQVSLYDKVSKERGYKTYFHCFDEVTPQEDYLCFYGDYGATPLSIVQNKKNEILRTLERLKYRYDDDFVVEVSVISDKGLFTGTYQEISSYILKKTYYDDIVKMYLNLSELFLTQWITLKKEYLNLSSSDETVSMYNIWKSASAPYKNYLDDNPAELNQSQKYLQAIQKGLSEPYKTHILPNNCFVSSVDDNKNRIKNCEDGKVQAYKTAVRKGEVSQEKNKYDLLYEFREWLKKSIFKDWITESMKCKIEHNASGRMEWINLEIIRESVSNHNQQSLYIKDCHSPAITEFLAAHGIDVIAQKGMENFKFYNEIDSKANDSDRWDVLSYEDIGSSHLLAIPVVVEEEKEGEEEVSYKVRKFTEEPDFLNEFKVKMENWYFNERGQSENDFNKVDDEFIHFENILKSVELDNQINTEIKEENMNYFRTENYVLNPGFSRSFDYVFTHHLSQGARIDELTNSPYLLEVYENFQVECVSERSREAKCSSLKSYLLQNGEVMVVVSESDNKFIIFPYQRDSLAAKCIFKYNELEREKDRVGNNSTLPQVFKDLIIKSIEDKLNTLLLLLHKL